MSLVRRLEKLEAILSAGEASGEALRAAHEAFERDGQWPEGKAGRLARGLCEAVAGMMASVPEEVGGERDNSGSL